MTGVSNGQDIDLLIIIMIAIITCILVLEKTKQIGASKKDSAEYLKNEKGLRFK